MAIEQNARKYIVAFHDASDLGARVDAWLAIIAWIRGDKVAPLVPVEVNQRLKGLLGVLAQDKTLHAGFLDTLEVVFREADGLNLFGEAGIPNRRGFWAELLERCYSKILPQPRNDHDLASLLRKQFRNQQHLDLFFSRSPETYHQILEVLAPANRRAMWAPIRRSFADGLRLLAARVQVEGLAEGIRQRFPLPNVESSPFFRLAKTTDLFLVAWETGKPIQGQVDVWNTAYQECWESMASIRKRLEEEGVSVDIVFALFVIQRAIARMKIMIEIAGTEHGPARSAVIQRFLGELIQASHEDRSIRSLLKTTTRLLHRAIVERSGETGEHYIAENRREYSRIWLAAAGGGLVTTLTAAIKVVIHRFHLPPFAEGMAYGLNYAISFLFLGAAGLMLATKQPAMTAAKLAVIMKENSGRNRVNRILDLTIRIFHSQLAAALANVAAVALGALAMNALWQTLFGKSFVESHEARELSLALGPLTSGTVFFAALTGVILFASSVIGGWFDNWFVFHRLPQAIADLPYGKYLGKERLSKIAQHTQHHFGSWMTNISLGFMLGLTPALGRFLGLPLDVRHVTLNTGILSLAVGGVEEPLWKTGFFLHALAGIGVMFILNLSVSFYLSLYTAAKAYALPKGEIREFLKSILLRFLRSPLDFVFPFEKRKN